MSDSDSDHLIFDFSFWLSNLRAFLWDIKSPCFSMGLQFTMLSYGEGLLSSTYQVAIRDLQLPVAVFCFKTI